MTAKQPNREGFLDRLFATYRELLGEFEPTPAFAAKVWAKIESRKRENDNWLTYLIAWSPRLAFASFAVALLLTASQWLPSQDAGEAALLDATYVDVLRANSLDEEDGALWMVASNGR